MRRRKVAGEAPATRRGGGWEVDREDSTSSESQTDDLERSDIDVELLQAVEAEAFRRQIRSSFQIVPPPPRPPSPRPSPFSHL